MTYSMTKYDILRIVLNSFELIACITGIIHWKKNGSTHLR